MSDKPDRSILSGSIPVSTDDAIISNTVAEADIKPGYSQDIPWNNISTGNFGSVSFIRESSSVGKVCRDFIVSKHSYDGILQYTGEICRTRLTKSWSLKSLNEQS
ncbi:MAG: hypothetical protein GY789_01185 [Hyphomicrobiales bacterium]|nr:hypothetical protein [Hyphomicrobiales bacterium]MCP5001789.1 hypothetical protein [Hyphomicrobiales bacterium]